MKSSEGVQSEIEDCKESVRGYEQSSTLAQQYPPGTQDKLIESWERSIARLKIRITALEWVLE